MSDTRDLLPFSTDGYLSIIEAARKADYTLTPICEAHKAARPTMILRHDVDFSVACALAMARLEHEHKIRSTYFFMTTCDYYNVFNTSSRDALRAMIGMGHEIGLHWDSNFLPPEQDQRGPFLRAQLALLGAAAGTEIVSASQHIPAGAPLFDISPYVQCDAYGPAFTEDFAYVSDSSMVWREKTPLDLIPTGVDIQFLAHPLWWMLPGANQEEKIAAVIDGAQKQLTSESQQFVSAMRVRLEKRAYYDKKFAERRTAT